MSTWGITLSLMRPRLARNFVLPRFTPQGWWECDVFELTPSGYFREYEIKMSRGDFLADARKANDGVTKHQRMRSNDGPTRFWYVVPWGLVDSMEVPLWAGLIYMRDRGEGHRAQYRWSESEQRPAPTLHRAKSNPETEQKARVACYWRLHERYLKGTA